MTIVISDNHGFQVIRRLQMNVTGHHFGNELRHRVGAIGEGPLEGDYLELDLPAVAGGLGARALLASTPDEVRDALAAARDAAGPVVIVVPTEPGALAALTRSPAPTKMLRGFSARRRATAVARYAMPPTGMRTFFLGSVGSGTS